MRMLALAALLVVVGCKKKPPEEEVTVPTTTPVEEAPKPKTEVPVHVQEMARNFERVYFDFDASSLGSDSKAALDANVSLMQAHGDVRVEVQGHADERGTTDYNIALGQRRAQSVVEYMQAKGIAGSRIKTVSYGEERPASSGSNETAWAANRRAEFVIIYGGDGSVHGTTGG